MVILVHR